MSKLFKKLRQELIEEGALFNYFKYAFGEIILTILGIILALQVHTWNERRIDRAEIQTILNNLGDEFTQNEENFQACRNELVTSLSNAKNLIEMIGKKESYLKTLNIDSLMAVSFAYKRFAPSEDVISVLLETGNLKLITNDKVRNLLYAWSANKSTITNSFSDLESNTHKLFDYLTKHYSLKDLDYYTSERLLGKSNLTIDKYAIFQDIVFENHLDNQIYYMHSYLAELDHTHKIIADIIKHSKEKD